MQMGLRKVVSMQADWNICTDPDDFQRERYHRCPPRNIHAESSGGLCPSNYLSWSGKCREGEVATGRLCFCLLQFETFGSR